MKTVNTPISDTVIRDLTVGDPVLLNGVMITGRDTVHKWLIETFIRKTRGDDVSGACGQLKQTAERR